VGAKSRAEAVDYVCDIYEDNDKSVKKRVKLWDDDLADGYVIGKGDSVSDTLNWKKWKRK